MQAPGSRAKAGGIDLPRRTTTAMTLLPKKRLISYRALLGCEEFAAPKTSGNPMEEDAQLLAAANREAAEEALARARNCILVGDFHRGERLLGRAQRLCPTLDGIDAARRELWAAEEAAAEKAAAEEAAAEEAASEEPSAGGGSEWMQEQQPVEDRQQLLASAPAIIQQVLRAREAADHYGVLGVENGTAATTAEIRKRYLRLLKLAHPDKCQHALADEAASAAVEAWELLSDPRSREIYDATLAQVAVDEVRKRAEGREAANAAAKAKAEAAAKAAATAAAEEEQRICCAICMEAVTADEAETEALPCHQSHFHRACIAEWLARNPTCPLCKRGAKVAGVWRQQASRGGLGGGASSSSGSNGHSNGHGGRPVPPPPRPPEHEHFYDGELELDESSDDDEDDDDESDGDESDGSLLDSEDEEVNYWRERFGEESWREERREARWHSEGRAAREAREERRRERRHREAERDERRAARAEARYARRREREQSEGFSRARYREAEFAEAWNAYLDARQEWEARFGEEWRAHTGAAEAAAEAEAAAAAERAAIEAAEREALREQAAPFLASLRASAQGLEATQAEAADAWHAQQQASRQAMTARLEAIFAGALSADNSSTASTSTASTSSSSTSSSSTSSSSTSSTTTQVDEAPGEALLRLVATALQWFEELRVSAAAWQQERATVAHQWANARRLEAESYRDLFSASGGSRSTNHHDNGTHGGSPVRLQVAAEVRARAGCICDGTVRRVDEAMRTLITRVKGAAAEAAFAAAKAAVAQQEAAWRRELERYQREGRRAGAAFEGEAATEAERMLAEARRAADEAVLACAGAESDDANDLAGSSGPVSAAPRAAAAAGSSSSTSSSSAAKPGSPSAGSKAAALDAALAGVVAQMSTEAEVWREAQAGRACAWAADRLAQSAAWSQARTEATRRFQARVAELRPEAEAVDFGPTPLRIRILHEVNAAAQRAGTATAKAAERGRERTSQAALHAQTAARQAAAAAAISAARSVAGRWRLEWQAAESARQQRRQAEEERWAAAAEAVARMWAEGEAERLRSRLQEAKDDAKAKSEQSVDWHAIGAPTQRFRVCFKVERSMLQSLPSVQAEVAAWVGSKLAAARRWKEARERDAAGSLAERRAAAEADKRSFLARVCASVGARSKAAGQRWAEAEGRPVLDFLCAECGERLAAAEQAAADEGARVGRAASRAEQAAVAAAEEAKARINAAVDEAAIESKVAAAGAEAAAAGGGGGQGGDGGGMHVASCCGKRPVSDAAGGAAGGGATLGANSLGALSQVGAAGAATGSSAKRQRPAAASAPPVGRTRRPAGEAHPLLPSPASISLSSRSPAPHAASTSSTSSCAAAALSSALSAGLTPRTVSGQGLAPAWRRKNSFLSGTLSHRAAGEKPKK